MAITKLKNEKKIVTFFAIACAIIFLVSAIFLIQSIKKDELGGSFLTAMLLFVSGYGFIIFIARIVRYKFIAKLQKAVLEEDVKSIPELEKKFGKSNKEIEKQLTFLIDNGYLEEYSIVGDRVINQEAERIRLEMLKSTYLEKQVELQKIQADKQEKKTQPKKKTIESEKCPNCGAIVKFNNGSATCPYCGNSLKQE